MKIMKKRNHAFMACAGHLLLEFMRVAHADRAGPRPCCVRNMCLPADEMRKGGLQRRRVESLKLTEALEKDKQHAQALRDATAAANAAGQPAECSVCGNDEITTLEGVRCPSREHFLCEECLSGWVLSESTPADEHAAKDPGEVWCPCKPGPKGTGCASERPLAPKVRPSACLSERHVRSKFDRPQSALRGLGPDLRLRQSPLT